MKALVVGYGSIGKRHKRVLEKMGIHVYVVSRRALQTERAYISLTDALIDNSFDYIIIANETSAHFKSLKELVEYKFKGIILVEKPLFSKFESIELNETQVYIAYNFRFHPLIEKLKEVIKDEQVISANVYVGQYLPSWRPDDDYKSNYSAFSEQGGGVLRDLSHELDYLTLLFGEWKALTSVKRKISNLEIQSEDYVSFIYESKKNVHVSVELNYIDRIHQRYITVQTNNKTVKLDFIKNNINCNGGIISLDKLSTDYTYKQQHQAVLSRSRNCCSYQEGLKIMEMIEAVEKSASEKEWVFNE